MFESSIDLWLNGNKVPKEFVTKFEWSSSINNGYYAEAVIEDRGHWILDKLGPSGVVNLDVLRSGGEQDRVMNYLVDGRRKPVTLEWSLVNMTENTRTDKRLGYVLSIRGHGVKNSTTYTITAQDPPTYLLSAGVADGEVFTGTVKEAIVKCVTKYTTVKGSDAPQIRVDVSNTLDTKSGRWPMFRMDPRTYITSLLEWSSGLTEGKKKPGPARWIVASNDNALNIKKASDMRGIHLGAFSTADATYQVFDWDMEMNSFMSLYQARLISAGISATTGAELERIVRDEVTGDKINAYDPSEHAIDRSFTKPSNPDEWPVDLPATYIRPVPEHSGGEAFLKYGEYMDGRARQVFEDMLTNVLRLRIRVRGEPKMGSSDLLGVSTCSVNWMAGGAAYWPSGPWMVDGFCHVYDKMGKQRFWVTDLYLYRLDQDAEAWKADWIGDSLNGSSI